MTGFIVDGDSEGIVRGKKEVNMGLFFEHQLCFITELRSAMLGHSNDHFPGCSSSLGECPWFSGRRVQE